MQLIEIIVIIACVLIVGGVILRQIVNKKKGKTSCGCDCSSCSYCSSCKKENKTSESQTEEK